MALESIERERERYIKMVLARGFSSLICSAPGLFISSRSQLYGRSLQQNFPLLKIPLVDNFTLLPRWVPHSPIIQLFTGLISPCEEIYLCFLLSAVRGPIPHSHTDSSFCPRLRPAPSFVSDDLSHHYLSFSVSPLVPPQPVFLPFINL